MELFTPTARVTAAEARHDLIQLWMEPYNLTKARTSQPFEKRDSFLDTLALAPQLARWSWDAASQHGIIYCRPTGVQNSGCHRLTVRQTDFKIGDENSDKFVIPPPLFGGHIDLTTHAVRSGTGNASSLSLLLKHWVILNPTRFVRHQQTLSLRQRARLNPQGWLFKSSLKKASPLDESTFDLNDNWLLQGETKLPEVTPAIYEAQQSRYFQGVSDRIGLEIATAAQSASLTLPPTPWRLAGTLTKVETYFEFLADEPHQVVRSFENVFKAHALATQRSRGQETVGDAPGWHIDTAKGEIVRLYAKTDQRIRFEVVHTLKGTHRRLHIPTTFSGLASLNSILARLREESASVVNRLLASAQPRTCHPSQWLSPVRFIFEVIRACSYLQPRGDGDEFNHARQLVERLTTKGSIRARKGHPLHAAIHKLKEWSLLELQGQPHQGNFVPSPKARFAVQTLSAGSRLHLYFDAPGVPPVRPLIESLANPAPASTPEVRS